MKAIVNQIYTAKRGTREADVSCLISTASAATPMFKQEGRPSRDLEISEKYAEAAILPAELERNCPLAQQMGQAV